MSMGFSRQEYWDGLPLPSSGDLPNPGIEPGSPHCGQTLYHLNHQGRGGEGVGVGVCVWVGGWGCGCVCVSVCVCVKECTM